MLIEDLRRYAGRGSLLAAVTVSLAACGGGGGGGGGTPPVPTAELAFLPSQVLQDEISTLRVTLGYAGNDDATGVAFTLPLPSGLVASGTPATTTCTSGAEILTVPGSGDSLALSQGRIPADSTCFVELAVSSTTVGIYPLALAAGALTSSAGATNAGAEATLQVLAETTSRLPTSMSGVLSLLHPEEPLSDTNPLDVATPVTQQTLYAASVDAATSRLDHLRPARQVYTLDSKLYVVDLLIGASGTPSQVSSLATACYLESLLPDYSNVDHGWILVETRGADGSCSQRTDNGQAIARLDTASTTAALAPAGLTRARPLHGADGAIIGFLSREGDALVRRDAAFASPIAVATLKANSQMPLFVERGFDRWYLAFQPAASSVMQVHSYDVDGGTLTMLADTLFGLEGDMRDTSQFVLDADNIYFGEAGSGPTRIRRIAHAGGDAQTLTTLPDGSQIVYLLQTDDRIVIQYFAPTSGSFDLAVATIAKDATDGAATVLDSGDQSSAAPQLRYAAASGRIYVSKNGHALVYAQTGALLGDTADAVFAGAQFADAVDLMSDSLVRYALIATSAKSGDADTRLDLFEPESGALVRTLGTFTARYLMTSISGMGRYTLINTQPDRSNAGVGPFDNDVYLADTATDDSIVGIGTQSGTNESGGLSCVTQCGELSYYGGSGF